MVTIIVDKRELRSLVSKELERLNCELQFDTLETADYILSDRVAIERKDIDDFFKSWLTDKKLFSQLIDTASAYERPILIIEGGDPYYSGRQINPKAIMGLFNTLALMRVPVLYSLNAKETALIMSMIADREQNKEKRILQMHGKRSHLSPSETQEYICSSIPNVGRQTSIDLLTHFGNLESIFRAGISELQEVDGIGEKTACNIRNITSMKYKVLRREI